MEHFSEYSIPILGLRDGTYQYKYKLDRLFFAKFEDSPIEDAQLDVVLDLDKRSSTIVLDLTYSGTLRTECDKCTAEIDLPIQSQFELIVKHAEMEAEEEDVVFILPSTSHFNIAKYLYEYAVLSLPLVRIFDCTSLEVPPCNQDVLDKLESNKETETDNPVWDVLKKMKE